VEYFAVLDDARQRFLRFHRGASSRKFFSI
jgi:hypothetical protein